MSKENATIYRVVEVVYEDGKPEDAVFTTDFDKVLEEVKYSAEEYSEDVLVEVIKPDDENYDKYEKLLEN